MSKKNLNYDHFLKAVLVGNSGVGKSSFLTRFADDEFKENYFPTIGVDFKIKIFEVDDSRVKL